MKSFSVVIPTLNEQSYITSLLNDIKNQPEKPNEIIVVDGFSTDSTRELVQKYKEVTLLKCPPQTASQRNFGAKQTTGSILFFLDADTRLPNNFFAQSVKKMSGSTVACPYYLPYNSNIFIYLVYVFFNSMFFLFQKISASGAGSSIIVERTTFNRIGGFNIHVKFEDIEFIRRAAKKYSFRMLPQIIWVSDRRFKKYGLFKTTLQYLLLSFLFLFNQFNYSPLSYQFGKFDNSSVTHHSLRLDNNYKK